MLNALDYGVPQKRECIIIVGFREKVSFSYPEPIPVSMRATVKDIIDPEAENDRSFFVKPAIRESRLLRNKQPDFPRPYISHENVAGSITPHNFSCALRAGASANYILINDERRPSARPVGKFRQTLALREVKGKVKPDVPVWKSVTVRRIVSELDAFVRACLTSV